MTDLLRILRARWVVVALAVTVALVIGWVTVSLTDVEASPARSHSATAVLLSSGGSGLGLTTIAAFVEIEPLAQRVAARLGFDGDPPSLSDQISGDADEQAGIFNITATAPTGQEAKALADAYAEELISFLTERRADIVAANLQELELQLDQLNQEIATLARQITRNPDRADVLDEERNAKVFAYGSLQQQYQTSLASASQPLGLEIIQNAIPGVAPEEVFQPPRSRFALMLIAGVFGLLAGTGIALALERLRAPIRTKQEAETHFGAPVLAEIPTLNRRERDSIASAVNPRSPSAEAFRLLEAGIDRSSWWNGKGQAESGRRTRASLPRVIVVTSSSPGEGKTTVVANLATAYAERGKRVVILSCDFRHPRIHRLFDIPNDPGLSEALQLPDIESAVHDYTVATFLPGVSVVPSGAAPDNPSELLGSLGMRSLLASVRRDADVVLIDTAPILWAADAAHLVPEVDAVLLVARSGETRVDGAKRTAELMALLKAPVIGVVLNATMNSPLSRRYYEADGGFTNQHAGTSPSRVSPSADA